MATRIKSNQIADNSIVAADLHSGIAVNTTASGTFGSVIVDNFTLDGTTLALSSGDMTLDSAGRIILDAATDGDIRLHDGSSMYGQIFTSSDDMYIRARRANAQHIFNGTADGSTFFNSLSIDYANSGRATFSEGIIAGGDVSINSTSATPLAVHGATAGDVYVQVVNTQAAATSNQSSIEFRANSSTQERQTVKITGDFTDITDASRDSRLRFYTFANGTQVIPLTLSENDATFAGNVDVGGNVVVTGNLTVEGSQVTLETTALDVEDKNITLNYHATADTSASADGAGITIQDAVNGTTDATILWDATNDEFDFSHTVNVTGNLLSDGLQVDGTAIIDGGTGVGSTGVLHVRQNGDGDGNGIAITSSNATSHRIWKDVDGNLNIGSSSLPSSFVQDLSGQVGLGTSDPSLKLDVATSSGSAGSFNRHIALTRGTSTGGFLGTYRAAANNNVDRMALGVGTTPTVTISSNSLDVTGGISVSEERHTVRPTLLLDFANSKRTPPNLRFSRSSSATYWGGSFTRGGENIFADSVGGNLPRARTNYVSSTTGPDGTGSAEIYSPDTQTGTHYITIGANAFQSAVANQRTISIYAKYINTVTHIVMGVYGYNAARAGACFDVQNGTFANYASTINGATNDGYSIEDVGNGWRRYAVTITVPSGSQGVGNVTIAFNNAATTTVIPSFTGAASNADQIGLFGLQIENRDSVTAYTPTTGYKITESIPLMKVAPVNYARIDHHPDTGICRGLLIEEQRINYIPYSDFSGGWTVANGGRKVANYAMAPDGTKTANSISKTDGNVSGYVRHATPISVTNGEPLIFSVFAKAGSFNFIEIGTDAFGNGGGGGTFDLSNGTVYSGNGTIENIGGGWHRCILRGDATSTTVTPFLRAREFGNSNGESHGYHNILAWGAQLETGSNAKFVTSYIPTAGSATTRTPEYAGLQIQPTSSSSGFFFNPNKGTFYTEQYFPWDGSNDTTTRYPVSLRNISVLVLYKNSNSNAINTYDNSTALSRTVTSPGLAKLAMGYEQGGDKNLSYNGSTISNAFNGGAWLDNYSEWYAYSANDFMFGNDNNNHAWIKKIAYYPEKMTNGQLSALTENN